MSESVLPVFSFRSFIVSALTFRSLIHFKFIFMYVVRKCLVSLFYMWLTSFPSSTCQRLSFLHGIFFTSLSKIRCPQMHGLKQMEKNTMFVDCKNQYSENEYMTQSNPQIQCNPYYQATNGIFHRTRINYSTICMEM